MTPGRRARGFTLVELLVVLLLIALLASISAPVVNRSIERASEAALREDLFVLRKTLDDYYADHGRYPETLATLVHERYLRAIPVDPLTGRRDTWVLTYADDGVDSPGIMDVHSGAPGEASDNTRYADW